MKYATNFYIQARADLGFSRGGGGGGVGGLGRIFKKVSKMFSTFLGRPN